jgi:hypothetical protein
MIIPKNEQGVVVLFSQTCHKWGIEIIDIRTQFPDAIIRKDSKDYRAEFEFLSSNFISHKHDDTKCELIICWKNDLELSPLPIIELSTGAIDLELNYEDQAKFWRAKAKKLMDVPIKKEIQKIKEFPSIIKCPDCGNSFVPSPYVCEHCGATFKKQNGLNGHIGRCKAKANGKQIERMRMAQ